MSGFDTLSYSLITIISFRSYIENYIQNTFGSSEYLHYFPCILLETLSSLKENIHLFSSFINHSYSIRNDDLKCPKHRTTFIQKHILYNGITLFKKLSSSLKNEAYLSRFRKQLIMGVLVQLCCCNIRDFQACDLH